MKLFFTADKPRLAQISFMKTWLRFCMVLATCLGWAQEPVPNSPEAENILGTLIPPQGWEQTSAKEWAGKLHLPVESETPYQSSYRAYPRSEAQLLGAHPKSMALVATEDRPDQLTLVFANKGDSAGEGLRFGEKQNRSSSLEASIEKMIDQDAGEIRRLLTTTLGKPRRQGFGDFGKTRESAERWDHEGTAFLLIEQKGEYTALRILPAAVADAGGRSARISDAQLRERMKANVVRRENGDVVVGNIPMLDQGPKGFCVPATYARVLIYSGVPADLYLLALLGKTGIGGGTYGHSMENSARALAASYGRSITSVSPALDLPKLESYFERGIPLTWALFVDEEINQDLTRRMKERPTTDPATWSKMLEPHKKAARNIRKNPRNGHVCLLIGCNRETGELATSDSWGPEFAERWITLEEARALSQGDLGAIVP
jgi:hypothetical protein